MVGDSGASAAKAVLENRVDIAAVNRWRHPKARTRPARLKPL